jgi:DNA helicase IV
LFYVSITRAAKNLIILTETGNESPFISQLNSLKEAMWHDFLPVEGNTPFITVTISNQLGRGGQPTFSLKNLLKADGFKWRTANTSSWVNTYEKDSFSLTDLIGKNWARIADGIKVHLYENDQIILKTFFINNGQWELQSIANDASRL